MFISTCACVCVESFHAEEPGYSVGGRRNRHPSAGADEAHPQTYGTVVSAVIERLLKINECINMHFCEISFPSCISLCVSSWGSMDMYLPSPTMATS